MSRTFVQPGNSIDAVAPAGGVSSGDVVVVGSLVGVAETNAAEGETYALTLTGVHRLPKAVGAILAGAVVWFDAAAGKVVAATGIGLWPLGAAVAAAGTNDTEVLVRLNGVAVAAALA